MIVPKNGSDPDWAQLFGKYPLAPLTTCPQDPEHHSEGDVFTHTKMVAASAQKLAAAWGLNEKETDLLTAAAIFHDIGKPLTLEKGEDGRWSSKKHALKGTSFLRTHLWKEGSKIPLQERELLLNLVRLHAWPVRFIERTHPETTVIEASLATSNKLLGLLAVADMQGRVCLDPEVQKQGISAAELYLEYAKELQCLNSPFPFPNSRTKLAYLNRNGEEPPTINLYDEKTFEVTMLSGLPGSGKDHWLEKNYPKDLAVISRDEIRKEYKKVNEGEVLQEFTARIKIALAKKQDFAINATFLRKETRRSFLNLITAYGGKTHVIYLQADRDTLVKRIEKRARENPTADVPIRILDGFAASMEPPTAAECHQLTFLDTNPPPQKTKKREPSLTI